MKPETLALAVKIIMQHGTKVKVSFNVPVTDSYSNVHEILIHDCCAGLINVLVKNGYSLHLSEKGLSVTHFGVAEALKS